MKTDNKSYLFTITISLLTLIALPACNDQLEVAPQGELTEEAIRADPAAAQALVTGVYNGLYSDNVYGQNFIDVSSVASDDADKGSTPTDNPNAIPLDDLTMESNNFPVSAVWNAYYGVIARANQALSLIPLSPAAAEIRARYSGEVRFLRALMYFNLVRIYGGVPLIDTVPPLAEINNPAFQRRASRESIYDFIQRDLEFAMNSLPVKGVAEYISGRATKGAAMGMLAKVFLYRQNYDRAYSLTDSLIKLPNAAGTYGLLTQYDSIWRENGENSVESLFEVQAGISTECNTAVNLYSVYQGPRAGGQRGWRDLGFGLNTPSQSLVNEYEPNDQRSEATIIFINPSPAGTVLWDGFRIPSRDSVENDRYNYKAYHSRTQESNCNNNPDRLPKNIRILRFGEILLIHAEAALAIGRGDEALTDITRLRTRAGLTTPLASVTREDIWHERRVEMGMEHDRYFDLVRQEAVQPGRAVAAFAAEGKTWIKGKHEVFPIPSTQIQLSGNQLEQNPNYR
ncbi:MAG: RagB/SusD family nutrient uptake outer membrane protein [Chitinophagaceae bacterium]|nr:RagB/SusD family nutrient uptake outer membrane protein [Chitinophagaceae bacterium]